MDISPPRLARDLIRLLIAVIRLIIAILTFVGGATNYHFRRCSALISTNSFFRMDILYMSLRDLPAKRVYWCMLMYCGAGAYPPTFTICARAGISQL